MKVRLNTFKDMDKVFIILNQDKFIKEVSLITKKMAMEFK
jgi:hypothetical protein